MTQPVRIGIAGAGFAARFHLRNIRRVYGVPVEITGVTARSLQTREAFAQEFGVRVFDSFAVLCDASDVISLCTPPSTHEELSIEALRRGKHLIIEKPLTGFFGPPGADPSGFRGNAYPKEEMLRAAVASCRRIEEAAQAAGRLIGYAENWIYAPVVQKETELVTKSGAQILWMLGNQSHSGSHSPYYGQWRFSGGGSLVGKSCHPLSAALYLKRAEASAANTAPIRPATVSARTHAITRLPGFRDLGFLRTGYQDIEDYGQLHITFTDGTVADIFASELMLGGVSNWIEVICNNHRTHCSLNPVDALSTFIAKEDAFRDVYLVEKLGTNQGWSHPAPDEAWQHGYPQEFQDFLECFAQSREPASNLALARDTIATLYAGYLSAERKGIEVEIPS